MTLKHTSSLAKDFEVDARPVGASATDAIALRCSPTRSFRRHCPSGATRTRCSSQTIDMVQENLKKRSEEVGRFSTCVN
eukprot:751046-Hanusia_phi.AAC.4